MGVLIWLFLSAKGLSGIDRISPLAFLFLFFFFLFFFFYSGSFSSVPGSPSVGSSFMYFI